MRKKLIVLLAVLMALSTAMFALSLTSIGGSAAGYVPTAVGLLDFDEYENETAVTRWSSGDDVATTSLSNDDSLIYAISRFSARGSTHVYNDGTESYARILRNTATTSSYYHSLIGWFSNTIPANTKLRVSVTFRLGNTEDGVEFTTTQGTAATFTFEGTTATTLVASDATFTDYADWTTLSFETTLEADCPRFTIRQNGSANSYFDVKEVSFYSYNNLSFTPNYASVLTDGVFDEVEVTGTNKSTYYLGGLQAVELFGQNSKEYFLSNVDGNLRVTSNAESGLGQVRFRYAENFVEDTKYNVTLTVRKGTTVVSEDPEVVPEFTTTDDRGAFFRIGSGATAIYDQITTDFTDITVTVTSSSADYYLDLFVGASAGSYLEISAIKVEEYIEPEEVDPNAPTEPYYETIWKTSFTEAVEDVHITSQTCGDFTGFNTTTTYSPSIIKLSIVEDETSSGTFYYNIERVTSSNAFFYYKNASIVAGSYEIKIVFRTSVGITGNVLQFRQSSSTSNAKYIVSDGTTDWQTYTVAFSPSAALANGRCYVASGLTAGTTLQIKSFEIYDPTTYVDPTVDDSIKPINVDFSDLTAGTEVGLSTAKTELTVPDNTYKGGFVSVYKSANGAVTIQQDTTDAENAFNYLSIRDVDDTENSTTVRFTFGETITTGTFIKFRIVYKPTGTNTDYHDDRGTFIRMTATANDFDFHYQGVLGDDGWYVYEIDTVLRADVTWLQIYNYANNGHGIDIKNIYIEEIPAFTSTTLSGNMATTYKYLVNDRPFDLTPDETQLFGGITGIVNKSNSKHVAPVKISENNTIIIKSRSDDAYWTGFGLNLKDKVSPSSTYNVSMKLRISETFGSTSSDGLSDSLVFRFSTLASVSNYGSKAYYDLYNEATADSDGFRTVNFTINSTTSEDIDQLWLYLYGTKGSSVEIADIKIETVIKPIIYLDETNTSIDMGDKTTLFDAVASADETKEFIGWYNPKTGLLPAGADVSTLTLPTFAKFKPIYATLDYVGASVKIAPNQASGLQFRTKVDVDATFVEANNITFNTIIAPKDYVDQVGDFTKEAFETAGLSLLDTNYQTNLINYNDEYDYFVGNIVNLYNFNYAREFYGRGYITVDYANDTTDIVYADIDLESDARSIYNVAVMYYNDLTVEDADDLAVAKSYIDAVVNVNVTQESASVVNPYDGIDNNRDYQVPYSVSFNTQTKELTVTANEGSDWNLYSQLGNNYYRASIIINGDRKTPSSTDVVVPASTIADLASAVTSFDLTNFEFPPLFELKSFTQQSFVTGYSEEVVSQEEGDALYGQNITIGRDSLNSALSQAVGFGSADLGIPVYDADNGQMYMLYGDTFSSHGYGDSSEWQKYDADINHVNMTMAKTDKYSYDTIEANGGLKLDSFLTDTGFATEGNLKSPIEPVSDETSKLTTGAVIVNGTIYLFYSSNVPNTTVNNGGDGINLVYSGCIKSTDGVNWERVDDLTWTAFATDNANILDLAKYAGILDGDTNVVGGGVERISRDMDVTTTEIKEDATTGAKYLDIAKTGESYERMLFTFYENIPATTVELTIRFKVSDDFAHNDSSSKRVLMAEFGTSANRISITESIIEGLTPDENGWYTYTGTKTLSAETPYLRFYTWGNAGSILVDSFTVSVEGKNSAVLDFEQFDAGTAITNEIALYPKAKALNSHVAWHFTQMTPVQGDTGEYLYFYGQGGYRVDDIYMARVLKANIEDFSSYEYFAGRDENDASTWDSNPANAKPLIEVGTVSNISVAYNAGLNKWMFTYFNAMTETVDRDHKLQVRFADTIDGVYSSAIDLLTFESKAYQEFINYDPLTGYPNSYTYGVNQFYGAYVSSEWISDDGLTFYICMSQYNDCYNTSMVKVELQNVQ